MHDLVGQPILLHHLQKIQAIYTTDFLFIILFTSLPGDFVVYLTTCIYSDYLYDDIYLNCRNDHVVDYSLLVLTPI